MSASVATADGRVVLTARHERAAWTVDVLVDGVLVGSVPARADAAFALAALLPGVELLKGVAARVTPSGDVQLMATSAPAGSARQACERTHGTVRR